ncbi:hypothetical protein [Haloferax sp. ATB1]|uniref:hypothetical protein n=1 Tax=Haloferax sp. ATB1 TaxID=1508454 RepID=UPI0005B20ACF|nr:hypothetical protein [Haloferax sp. ATB1]
MPNENPLDSIVKLLRREFESAAVSVPFTPDDDIAPTDDSGANQPPYVSVSNKSESVVSGGETNATGMAADGSGAVQVMLGTCLIECNGGHRETAGVAQTVAHELAQETGRVLREATTDGELRIFEPTGPQAVRKTGREPPEHAEQLFATYEYEA